MPPGGQAVLDALRTGRPLNTFIIAGPNSWDRHRNRLDRVVLPPDTPPDDFDWRIFKDQSPTICGYDDDHARLKRLCWLLLRAGAKLVCLIFEDTDGVIRAVHFR